MSRFTLMPHGTDIRRFLNEKYDLLVVTDIDQNKCLQQNKQPGSPHQCAPISELPSYINTMIPYVQEVVTHFM